MNTTHRPSTAEEEYFAREEQQRRRAAALERQSHIEQDERARLEAPHDLHCPKCRVPLQKVTLQDVHIDRCSSCHGTWLDAGELEQFATQNAGVLRKIAEGASDRQAHTAP